jgi:stage II sporulation protein D
MQDCREVIVGSTEPVWVKSAQDLSPQPVSFPQLGSQLRLNNGVWLAGGNVRLGSGELTLTPSHEGTATIQRLQYRGRYRLVPITPNTFDVVNDVDVDGYLKSVISRELYPNWTEEAYKAQAIVARTYALYESRTIGVKRYWDVWSDERSQVYGGMAFETAKSVRAVDATAGVVVAYGSPGQERIFKAYFSSCCGGRTQSSRDAFGDDYTPVLGERKREPWCRISPRYNWETVSIRKDDLGRRIAAWAKHKSEQQGSPRPELNIVGVSKIEQAYVNSVGRPILFRVTDTQNKLFMMRAEDLRLAVCEAPKNAPKVYSADFTTINEATTIRFVNGRGHGHGVGMCQWCAQAQSQSGWRHEDIVLDAYPGAKLMRAY